MGASEIISNYYNNKEIVAFFKKVSLEWWEELRQEVFLVLCNYDTNKIEELHGKNQLKFFIVRIALNQFRSKTSPFYYQNFKKQQVTDGKAFSKSKHGEEEINLDRWLFDNGLYEEQGETAYQLAEKKVNQIETEIEGLRFFEREILKIYLELGTYKKVAENTGIPIRTVANGVKNAINNVNKSIKLKSN